MLALQVLFIYRFLSSSQLFFAIVQMKKLSLRNVQLFVNDIPYSYPGLSDTQTSTFSHHPQIINLGPSWNYHKFCHYFVVGSTSAHWLKHILMLWQASSFCVPGALLCSENFKIASFPRLDCPLMNVFKCQLCARYWCSRGEKKADRPSWNTLTL